MREVYFDNAATTRVRPEVAELMREVMEEDYGNPSSMHAYGVKAERYVREAREEIARILKAKPGEIFFNSGGTEGANTAILGTASRRKARGRHIISTAIEHPAVLNALKYLEKQGFEVTLLGVDGSGHVEMDELKAALRPDTILVSVMTVNNEIGAVEDLTAISREVRKLSPGAYIHTDAVQGFGKLRLLPGELGVDMLTVSAHKIHGPKGVGFMYLREKTLIDPLILGGGQQKGMRSGTENVPGIAGLGLAAKMYHEERKEITARMSELKSRLITRLRAIEGVTVTGYESIPADALPEASFQAARGDAFPPGAQPAETSDTASREDTVYTEPLPPELPAFAPHIVSASFSGVRAEVLLHALEERGVYVSSGSACSSNHPAPSATLLAIGLGRDLIDSTLRFSFGIYNEPDEADYAADQLEDLLPLLRRFRRR